MNTRRESPVRRKSPTTGRVSWIARYTNAAGKRVSGGSFDREGPCKKPLPEGACCAQHRIDFLHQAPESASRGEVTVRAYASTWTRTHPRSKRTDDTNEARLKALLGPFTARQLERVKGKRPVGVVLEGRPLGDWPLGELRRRHVLLLVDVLLVDQGRAAEGARGLLRTLSALFNDAITDEVCEVNPVVGVKVRSGDPRVVKPARAPRVFSWTQMHKLARRAGADEAMVRVVSDCGLRLGELLGLAADDVKLGRCDELGCQVRGPHLHVRRTAYNSEVTDGTKRERMRDVFEGGRVVPVPPATVALLRALPTRIGGPMFFTPTGKVWRQDNFYDDVWGPAREASGVNGTPQDFRHSWVSLLRAEGVDPADLAAISGHSVEVASGTYTHSLGLSYDVIRKAVGE